MIIVLFSLASGELRRLVNIKFIRCFVIGFVISLPWHLYEYHIYGKQFIDEYFFHQIFLRAIEPADIINRGNFFFYFGFLVVKNIPLGIASLLTIPYILFSLRKEEGDKRPALILLISSVTVILLLFSLVS